VIGEGVGAGKKVMEKSVYRRGKVVSCKKEVLEGTMEKKVCLENGKGNWIVVSGKG